MVGIEIRQQVRLTQSLAMTPPSQLAIQLLQLSRLELQEHVQQELVENPFLDEATDGKEEPAPFSRHDGSEELPQDHDTRYVQRGTLFDHVAWQVRRIVDASGGGFESGDAAAHARRAGSPRPASPPRSAARAPRNT